MVAYIFDRILSKGIRSGQIPARTREARTWFRDTALKTRTSATRLMKEDRSRLVDRIVPGKMYMFFYDPKHKQTLPYYDRFPLIVPIRPYSDGFLGINFHYLPPQLRAKLMDALYEITSNDRYDQTTKVRLSYAILKSTSKMRMFRPTIKRYLTSHVESRFLEITSAEWDIALMLPVAQFEKASQTQVWNESRKMINGM